MMRVSAVFLAACSLVVAPTQGEEPFPYTAEVSVAEVFVRCGPDQAYYPTMRLSRGARVEVYRHDPGGWLAIRPPQGSISWIPARQVKREDNARVGKVLFDGVVAWVGSTVGDVPQYKWQVRLQQNELVEILGEQSMSVGPGFATETYYKISPPAGEFRWIHAQESAAANVASTAHSASKKSMRSLARATTAVSRSDATPSKKDSTHDVRIEPATRSFTTKMTNAEIQALKKQVDQLKIDLSLLVTQDIQQWDLDALRRRAEALAKTAKGTPQARQVRLIAYRIDEFKTLQTRHERMTRRGSVDGPEDGARVNEHRVAPTVESQHVSVKQTSWQEDIQHALESSELSSRAKTPRTMTAIDRLAEEMDRLKPKFDAEGWLKPVHSTRQTAPPFALLDDYGRVICYVRPAPGLNLRRYANRYVGLFGERHQVPALRASLLTVTRVVKQKK